MKDVIAYVYNCWTGFVDASVDYRMLGDVDKFDGAASKKKNPSRVKFCAPINWKTLFLLL